MLQIVELVMRDNINVDEAESIQHALPQVNWNDHRSVTSLSGLYNALIAVINTKSEKSWAEPNILELIIELARDSIDVPNLKTTRAEAFTPLVYGELKFELIDKVTRQMNSDRGSVFLDFGSGIDQLVLQISGTMKIKKCVGIEIREDLHEASMGLGRAFRRWMAWFNKKHTEFVFFQGDFQTPQLNKTIEEATHMIANNIEFGPSLNNYLEDKLMEWRDGTEVYMSTTLHHRKKHQSNRKSIINVAHFAELKSLRGKVSWRNEPV